jgi:predicted dienelactone hydrolase
MNNCVRRAWITRWIGVLWLVIPMVALGRAVTGVGFAAIEVHDPVNGGDMPGYVFYPSATARGVSQLGPYELHAAANAPPIAGARPLVMISHGHGGSDLGHHDLAVYLASHGFIVAAITHPKDNFRDSSGDGHPAVLDGRPIQISAAISFLLESPRWAPLIDPGRIAVAGFSNGGYTALLLVGAVPRFTDLVPHCRLHPDDRNVCVPLAELEREAARHHGNGEEAVDVLQRSLHRWGNTDDPRVKAAFVMAPFSSVFDAAGLAHIDRPVFLYYGQHDEVLPPRYDVLHIAPLIKTLAGITMIPNAGHYVFLSPCSPELARGNADICQDPPGVDRVAVHRQLNASALSFFEKTLRITQQGTTAAQAPDKGTSYIDPDGTARNER